MPGPNLAIYHLTGCTLKQTGLKKLTPINPSITGAGYVILTHDPVNYIHYITVKVILDPV